MIGSFIIGLFGYGLAIHLGLAGVYAFFRKKDAQDYDVPAGFVLMLLCVGVAAGTRALL